MSQERNFLSSVFGNHGHSRRKVFYSTKAKFDASRTFTERMADAVANFFGKISFLVFNILLFLFWAFANTGLLPFIVPFDPYPFVLLTTIVSIEAIILSIFVLISQNRTLKLDDLRTETDLKINILAERENTKIMEMLALLLKKNGIDLSNDPELKELLKPISEEEIEKKLKEEIF